MTQRKMNMRLINRIGGKSKAKMEKNGKMEGGTIPVSKEKTNITTATKFIAASKY